MSAVRACVYVCVCVCVCVCGGGGGVRGGVIVLENSSLLETFGLEQLCFAQQTAIQRVIGWLKIILFNLVIFFKNMENRLLLFLYNKHNYTPGI